MGISQRKRHGGSVTGAVTSDLLNNQMTSVTTRSLYSHQFVKGKTIKSLTMPNVVKDMKKPGTLNAASRSENCHNLCRKKKKKALSSYLSNKHQLTGEKRFTATLSKRQK